MKKKISILILVIVFLVLLIYNKFYKIDLTTFNYYFNGEIVDSPTDKYDFRIQIWKSDENSSESYVMGRLV